MLKIEVIWVCIFIFLWVLYSVNDSLISTGWKALFELQRKASNNGFHGGIWCNLDWVFFVFQLKSLLAEKNASISLIEVNLSSPKKIYSYSRFGIEELRKPQSLTTYVICFLLSFSIWSFTSSVNSFFSFLPLFVPFCICWSSLVGKYGF